MTDPLSFALVVIKTSHGLRDITSVRDAAHTDAGATELRLGRKATCPDRRRPCGQRSGSTAYRTAHEAGGT